MNGPAAFPRPQKYIFLAAVLAVLLAGFLLRLLYLERYPLPLYQDELSNIYDGYSIVETGADRWGEKHPLILRGFGKSDYRPPLHAWLSALSIKSFGFSTFAGRLVSAVVGCASLILLYLVARRLAGQTFALIALLLTALSPWHILFSRIASEGTALPPFFLISSCYLWQRARENNYRSKSLILLGLCVGFGTNSYQASKLIFFLFTLLVGLDLWQFAARPLSRDFWRWALIFGSSCLLGALPQLMAALTMPAQFFSRANGSMIKFSPSFAYLLAVERNILVNLSPRYLFFSFGKYNTLSSGRLLLVECLLFYAGLYFIPRIFKAQQAIKPGYFYALILFAILPSALTTDNPQALRTSCLTVLTPLITATGVAGTYERISKLKYKRLFLRLFIISVIVNALIYLVKYVNSERLQNQGMQALLVATSKKLGLYEAKYDKVFIEESDDSQRYIFTATYAGIKPDDFQRAKKVIKFGVWDRFKQLDKYYYLTPEEMDSSVSAESAKVLMLLSRFDKRYQLIDSIEVNKEKVFFQERF